MFLGHFGVGLTSKKLAPSISLGVLFLCVQFADLLWPLFLLLGIEHVQVDPGNTKMTPLHFSYYPWSHSFLCLLLWGMIVGLLYFVITKTRKSLWLLPLLVLSHFGLDSLVHRPDLPLSPWSNTYIGLALWNSVPITLMLEGSLFLLGIIIYLRTTKAKNRIGSYGFWGFILFLVVIEVANFTSKPPNASMIAWAANAQWVLVFFGYWVDKHRIAL